MTVNQGLCFCCSGHPFRECCEPILANHALALTPVALMRSRYTAYVLEKENHLLATWAPATRPEKLSLQGNRLKWLELVIHSETVDQPDHNTGEVDFTARFLDHDLLCELRETSSFIREEGLWYYHDGKTDLAKTKVGRNGPCPCGSGRKFKRCCLNG